jgi:carbamoyltransferase
MKLLSVAVPHHDVNLAFFDGARVRYLKLERTHQEKRFALPDLRDWKREARAAWGDAIDAAADCAFGFDPAALPASVQQHIPQQALGRLFAGASEAEPLPPAVCEVLGVRSGWLVSHHLSHALSTWMLESQPADVRIVVDGVGDGRSWSVYRGDRLQAFGDARSAGSIGWGIRDAGKMLGVKATHYNDIAGKVMGLQAYGRVDPGFLAELAEFGMERLQELWSPRHWEAWRRDPLLARLAPLDWVATVHRRTGELLVDFFRRHAQPHECVSYSGGVAQNVVWNAQLREHFPHLVVPPHASDEGLSLGALEWLRRRHGLPPFAWPQFPYAQDDAAPLQPPSPATVDQVAQWLAEGLVVGWYQGHGEVGPRALGNRSILMDPRLPDGQQRLNRVKRREAYRPFGASVLAEQAPAHFTGACDAFMLYAARVSGPPLPAVTHVDGTCRLQLVQEAGNPAFHRLLARFHELTGCPVLANTSLNLAGKPLAAEPAHALALFEGSPLQVLAIGDELRRKS